MSVPTLRLARRQSRLSCASSPRPGAACAAASAADMGMGVVPLTESEKATAITAFTELGVCDELATAAAVLGWKTPSEIQTQSIPQALQGKDVIGLAQTGSGKTVGPPPPICNHRRWRWRW